MLCAPVRSLQSVLTHRPILGAAGLAVLAVTFLVSLPVRQPRVFTLLVPVGAGLILAQSVASTIWLARLRPGRPLRNAWIIYGQVAGALLCWLVLIWIFWLRT